jgi:hypothetical protein
VCGGWQRDEWVACGESCGGESVAATAARLFERRARGGAGHSEWRNRVHAHAPLRELRGFERDAHAHHEATPATAMHARNVSLLQRTSEPPARGQRRSAAHDWASGIGLGLVVKIGLGLVVTVRVG